MMTAVPCSLEDVRNQRLLTVKEFAAQLGISEQTYRRVLERDPRVENPTRRRIADRLHMPPHLLVELVPPPSAAHLAALTEAIRESNALGWYRFDPATGTLAETPEPVVCPPGPEEA